VEGKTMKKLVMELILEEIETMISLLELEEREYGLDSIEDSLLEKLKKIVGNHKEKPLSNKNLTCDNEEDSSGD
jgi:hypothetical protein